jgi:hypothetical protein
LREPQYLRGSALWNSFIPLSVLLLLQRWRQMSMLLIVRHHLKRNRGKAMATNGGNGRGERLQIMLSADELTILDDFRFKLRMPSRAAAIRELLKRGLASGGFEAAAFGSKSEEYGVIGKTPQGR